MEFADRREGNRVDRFDECPAPVGKHQPRGEAVGESDWLVRCLGHRATEYSFDPGVHLVGQPGPCAATSGPLHFSWLEGLDGTAVVIESIVGV